MKEIKNTKDTELLEKFTVFAEDIIKFCRTLETDHISQPIISELVKSSAAIGAVFCESQAATTAKDFNQKIFLSKKEVSASKYWLRLLATCSPEKTEFLKYLWGKADELTKILGMQTFRLK